MKTISTFILGLFLVLSSQAFAVTVPIYEAITLKCNVSAEKKNDHSSDKDIKDIVIIDNSDAKKEKGYRIFAYKKIENNIMYVYQAKETGTSSKEFTEYLDNLCIKAAEKHDSSLSHFIITVKSFSMTYKKNNGGIGEAPLYTL